MTSLSKTVSHDYDPKIVYHSHSSNLPHLSSWIDELISLNENSLPKQSTPNTNNLVEALQRYDAVYKELLRQTSIFSEPITKMLSKVWTGVLKLLDYMIKSYHRYVKHTSHLQSQAQNLLNERTKGEAANKVQKEEFDLERAHLRARIRNLESEVDVMRISQRSLENENDKLRRTIDVYITSSELNDPVWNLMLEDDNHIDSCSGIAGDSQHDLGSARGAKGKTAHNTSNSSSRGRNGQQWSGEQSNESNSSTARGFRRRDAVDAGRVQLRTLNRLDVELNEILANVLKEENRQRLLMDDVMRLVERNKDIFTADIRTEAHPDDQLSAITAEQQLSATRSDLPSLLPSARVSRKRNNHLPPQMKEAASSDRAVEDETGQQQKVRCVGVQIDDKDRYGVIEDTEVRPIEHQHLGVAPLAPLNVMMPGSDQPYQLRSYMTSFPKVLRVPPAAWACQMIMAIYLDKIQTDAERQRKGHAKQPLPVHMYNYFKSTLGLALAADIQVALLLKACESHLRKQPRVALFSSQLGLFNKDELPPMDVRDTDFVLHVLSVLIRANELGSAPDKKKTLTKMGDSLRPDVTRAGALAAVYTIFERWLPDGGEDYAMKVRAMPHNDRGPRFVDLDELMQIMMEPWFNVRSTWEEHARYLFHEHCSVHRVLQDATFANDEGVVSSDTILVEVHKASASDCIRRPLRLFQKTESTDGDFPGAQPVGNPNKESVCEVMDFRKFMAALLTVNPALPMTDIEAMFEEALDHAHDRVLRALEVMWTRCVDNASHGGHKGHTLAVSVAGTSVASAGGRAGGTNREFWVNQRNSISQWTRPYLPNVFRAQDIEVDSFVSVLIRRDVFPKSPLLDWLGMPPKDLWPHADMFHQQVAADQHRKEARATTAANPSIVTKAGGNSRAPTLRSAVSLPAVSGPPTPGSMSPTSSVGRTSLGGQPN